MVRVSCDSCGKEILRGEESHFVVRIEVYAAPECDSLSECDLAADNLEAVSELLKAQECGDLELDDPAARQQRRFDLCPHCRDRFLKNPLRPEAVSQFNFSQN